MASSAIAHLLLRAGLVTSTWLFLGGVSLSILSELAWIPMLIYTISLALILGAPNNQYELHQIERYARQEDCPSLQERAPR